LRFIIREVVLDQKRAPGQVWLKIVWQTGVTSEHHVQRRVHTLYVAARLAATISR